MRVSHLARRFATSLWPSGPSPEEDAWALAQLLDGERDAWRDMSPVDRRHAVQVARRVERATQPEIRREVLAAALLHDCGKAATSLGPFGRAAATVAAGAVRHDRARILGWQAGRGWKAQVGGYLMHPDVGAERLAAAGSHALTVAWTRQHHLPPDRWSVPPAVGKVLKDADDD